MGLIDVVTNALGLPPAPPSPIEIIVETTTEVAKNAAAEVQKGADDIGKNVEKGVQDAGKTAEKAIQDTGNAIEKGLHDIGNTLGKAGDDTVAQLGRSYEDVVTLAEASYHFVENQVEGYEALVKDAERRVSEGKYLDAVWTVMTDQRRVQEQSTADAVMESSILNAIATAAATTFGGPGGAAAYAAWYTYKATGNLEAALKAGAIAWATCSAGKAASGIQGDAFDAVARRTLATAAVGGASVAAAGGSDEQVLAAFGKGAVVGTVREVYRAGLKTELDGKPATSPPILKDGAAARVQGVFKTLPNGNLDITDTPADVSHVGISTATSDSSYWGVTETNGLMRDIARIPYMNNMAYFHDQWMAVTGLEGPAVQLTILPAIGLTYAGSDPALTNLGTQQVIDEAKKEEEK